MSQESAPFGLRPAFSPYGITRPGVLGVIDSGFAQDIFQNTPVAVDANGFLVPAAAGARAVGTFQGVEFTDTDGQFKVRNRWQANTIATDIRAYYTQTVEGLMYEIQADGPLSQADIGQQYNWTAPGGSSITGLSDQQLDTASAAANANVRIIGINPSDDNFIDDPFPIVLVQISLHQYAADQASV